MRQANTPARDKVIAALPSPITEMLLETGLCRSTVTAAIKDMHAKREVRISGWQPILRNFTFAPIYALGSDDDAPRPERPPEPHKPPVGEERDKLDAMIERDINKARIEARKNADRAAQRSTPFSLLFTRSIQCSNNHA